MTLFEPALGAPMADVTAAATGGVVTGLASVVTYLDPNGDQRVAITVMPGQALITTVGMVALLDDFARHQLRLMAITPDLDNDEHA